MRDLTQDEIQEYLNHARLDLKPEGFTLAQAQMIGDAAVRSGLLPWLLNEIGRAKEEKLTDKELLVSIWVSAFLMGRECQFRLFTLVPHQ